MTDNERRETEIARREAARSAPDGPVEALGEVPGRAIKQMLSLRMEPELIRQLRQVAKERGTSVSDLLRDAAAGLVASHGAQGVHLRRTRSTAMHTTFDLQRRRASSFTLRRARCRGGRESQLDANG